MVVDKVDYVYFMQSVKREGNIKIGHTVNLSKRIKECECGSVEKLEYIGIMEGGKIKEKEVHKLFKDIRIRGEWFMYSEKLNRYIVEYCDRDIIKEINKENNKR